MTWAPLLLIFLHSLTGSHAQFVLTQQISVSVSLGSKVTITSKHSSDNITKAFVHWLQPHFGSPPTTVIYDDDDRPSEVPGQLSGSIDSSSSSASLTIADLQSEDEADYYCQSSGSGFSHSAQNQG